MGRKSTRSKPNHPAGKTSASKHNNPKKVADVETAIKKKRNVRKGNCFNCGCDETETDLWRSDIFAPKGVKRMVCNACGLWSRDHRCYRPPHMWKHLKTRAEKAARLLEAAKLAATGQAAIRHASFSTVSGSASSSSTPNRSPSEAEIMSPFESPTLPLAPAPSPTNDYLALTPKPTTDDDFVAANTLLSMMNNPPSSSIHEAPPPLAKAPPLYHRSHHSYGAPRNSTYDSYAHGPVAHCQLFTMAAHSPYVPAWMDTHQVNIAPTTPTQATYGRRNSFPVYVTNASPSQESARASPSIAPTARILRPSIANLCETPTDYPSPEGSLPSLVYERCWSQTSSSQASATQSPQVAQMALGVGGAVFKDDSDPNVPDLARLALY